ncbi:MAG: Acyltransferase MdmB, partial [Nocardia sp.]|uniref:acyltransferase family protein n=1 Tax=Nocardia sp. TaxID=1821 RepID=UPI0026085F40
MTRPPEVLSTRPTAAATGVPRPAAPAVQPDTAALIAQRADRERPPLPSLTGSRWWAAFAVFVLHALVFLPVYPFQKSELFRHIHEWVPMQLGAAGVTFFFVLSGFIIYWSFRPGMSARAFYRRRVLK